MATHTRTQDEEDLPHATKWQEVRIAFTIHLNAGGGYRSVLFCSIGWRKYESLFKL
ncbi:hypothetical protein K438DRAFT_1833309, partial [Mycena galopus ATCC 62051]